MNNNPTLSMGILADQPVTTAAMEESVQPALTQDRQYDRLQPCRPPVGEHGFGMARQTIFTGKNRWQNYEFYAGDTFRLSKNLTVVYGLRWSFLPNPYLADNHYTVFNPSATMPPSDAQAATACYMLPGWGEPLPSGHRRNGRPNNALYNNNNHMIAPRLSLAYDPTGQGKWAIARVSGNSSSATGSTPCNLGLEPALHRQLQLNKRPLPSTA